MHSFLAVPPEVGRYPAGACAGPYVIAPPGGLGRATTPIEYPFFCYQGLGRFLTD